MQEYISDASQTSGALLFIKSEVNTPDSASVPEELLRYPIICWIYRQSDFFNCLSAGDSSQACLG
jgi:hypothetical protein